MYLRAIHAEPDIPSLRTFIRDNPLGLLITHLQPSSFPAIQCTNVPWVLDVADEASPTELGRLRGHLARNNPHCKALIEAIKRERDERQDGSLELHEEVSVVFNGPVHSYVTPKFYIESKPADGKVVPTWNYSEVQVYGKMRVLYDHQSEEANAFLQKQVTDLTVHCEEHLMGYTGREGKPNAWEVSDAPDKYIDLLKKSIMGIEITVDRLEGKYKMSQESSAKDQSGVIQGFEAQGTEAGAKLARTVEDRCAKKVAEKSAAVAAKQ